MKIKKIIYKNSFELSRILKEHVLLNKKIVFTNGCFDILHKGHLSYLKKAKRLGDLLVIGLNSDISVKKIKGPFRPYYKEGDRAYALSCLKMVDYICFFDEPTPAGLIRQVRPHVLVKGGDYKECDIAGAEYVKKQGGKVVILPFIKGYSTTRLIEKLKKQINL
ncbi:MAG: D-glycero-beta-D-manno-heptose 1-phosphate adenylyltransferase [Candidatus Aureabacteria bacterium]|nr:D-glycero-beta-D-manno-heptose 1-phosphate adenylyltransferase [Candidatus Auribacterota bacterium]